MRRRATWRPSAARYPSLRGQQVEPGHPAPGPSTCSRPSAGGCPLRRSPGGTHGLGGRSSTRIAAPGDAQLPTSWPSPPRPPSRTSWAPRPCIEPLYKNLFAKSNLSGDFTVLNPFPVRDLKASGRVGARAGRRADQVLRRRPWESGTGIPAEDPRHAIPTAFDIDPAWLIDAGRPAGKVDRPVAVAQPVPGRAGHAAPSAACTDRAWHARPQDHLLPADAGGLGHRQVVAGPAARRSRRRAARSTRGPTARPASRTGRGRAPSGSGSRGSG